MKQIQLHIPPPVSLVLLPEDSNPDLYYGVLLKHGSRGFITREKHRIAGGGSYTVRCLDGLTQGNGWDTYTKNSLAELIKYLLKGPKIEVYQFETYDELISWLTNE